MKKRNFNRNVTVWFQVACLTAFLCGVATLALAHQAETIAKESVQRVVEVKVVEDDALLREDESVDGVRIEDGEKEDALQKEDVEDVTLNSSKETQAIEVDEVDDHLDGDWWDRIIERSSFEPYDDHDCDWRGCYTSLQPRWVGRKNPNIRVSTSKKISFALPLKPLYKLLLLCEHYGLDCGPAHYDGAQFDFLDY